MVVVGGTGGWVGEEACGMVATAAVDTCGDGLVFVEDKWGGGVGKEAWRMVSVVAVECSVSSLEEDKHALAALVVVVIFCGKEDASVVEMEMAVVAEMKVEVGAASGEEHG